MLGEYVEDELIILLLHFALLQEKNSMLELCKEIIQSIEIGRFERHDFIFELVNSQVIMLSIQRFQFVPYFFRCLQIHKMEEKIIGNREA